MKITFLTLVSLIKKTFQGWQQDNASVWCAALAYYTVFSFGPLLLVVISILGLVYSRANLEENITIQMQALLGREGASLLQTVMHHTKKPTTSMIGTVIGAMTLVLGAAGVFGQLQQMLNNIWGVTQKPKSGIAAFIRSRLLNFTMIGVVAFLLLVSLVASTIIVALSKFLNTILPFSPMLLEIFDFLFSFFLTTLLFAFILKVLPDVQIKWRNVWSGAILTSLLFTIGKFLISVYIGHSGIASEFGAAASLIVLLLWVYYASNILFLGVEFTKQVTLLLDKEIVPSEFSELANQQALPEKTSKKQEREDAVIKVAKGFTKGFVDELAEHPVKKRKQKNNSPELSKGKK